MIRRFQRQFLAAIVLIAVGPGVAGGDAAVFEDPFPTYPALEGQIGFWVRVFSEWDLDEVAVHDMDYPAIVYEVVALEGPREFPYTDEQQEFVEDLREGWEKTLEALATKIDAGRKLNDDEKALVLKITAVVGTDGVREAHERVRTQRGLRERFARGLEISGRYMDRFREIFREQGLPEDLAFLPHVESSFQVRAHSSAGAVGIWQFTRGTGRQFLTVTSTLDERLDPVMATRGAARYFREAYDRLGNWAIAITSYNHGLHGMRRAKERFGDDFERIVREYDSRTFGFASRNFYSEFLAARRIAREPSRYFPEGIRAHPPLDLEQTVLEGRRSPARLSRDYGIPLDELAALNPAWTRRAIKRGHAIPTGTVVWLPEGTLARVTRSQTDGEHEVRRGDTLSTVATRYGLTVSELRKLNSMSPDEDVIFVGQKLIVGTDTSQGAPPAVHVVRRGETLSFIAEKYATTLASLRRLNGLSSDSDVIYAGQKLRVDASGVPDSVVHVVRRGDSLIEIATDYGVRLSTVLVANGLTTRSIIHPGQKILIPLSD